MNPIPLSIGQLAQAAGVSVQAEDDMKRILATATLSALAIVGWLGLVAWRCPGKCPLCP